MDPLPQPIADYISTMGSLDGWCSPQKATALANAILKDRPSVVVEIGVFAGRSLIAMALAVKQNGSGIVFGIDPWLVDASVEHQTDRVNVDWWGKLDHDLIYRRCMQACTTQGVLDHTVLIRGKSQQVAGLLRRSILDRVIDMLHIDGNHSEETSSFDVVNYVPLVRPGGVVVFDDTNWETTKKAQELLSGLCDFQFFCETEGQQCAFYLKR